LIWKLVSAAPDALATVIAFRYPHALLYQAAVPAWTVRLVVRAALPYEAVMVTTVVEETPVVLIVKVAEELPAGIVTETGTAATVLLLLDSVTTAPPVGALPVSVMVP
jgi:hypothetical protein